MKTILYNPIFINPLAYYVFPRLTRWLRPDDSYKEPANYIGLIEVTIIAYGEIGYTEYFEHTNYIDFTNFSNSYVRISLFTRLGSCVLGEWKIGTIEGDRPYIEPEVLASLKAVVIVGDKTNQDKDRDIVANLVDASNPFIISNAAYKLNSGYGKYEEDFTSWDRIDASTAEISNDGSKIKCINTILNVQYLFNSINKDIPSFKVKISNFTKGNIVYYYRKEDGTEAFLRIEPSPLDKVLELPKSYNTVEGGTGSRGGFYSSNINIGVTIEQIPSYQGAFVTDGVDDLITSTKTVQDMLGGSTEFTAVSMIHLTSVGQDVDGNAYTNYIRTSDNYWVSNRVSNTDKTGIYGYSFKQGTPTVINNILGDKNDYTAEKSDDVSEIFRAKFSVEGFEHVISGAVHVSSVAWYWTIIANKVLTTDQINQVIAYYNLDRCVEPTVLYDVKRQGLSNDTPDSDWYLKDFSKNGFDMSLFNFAKKRNSGIGRYSADFESFDWTVGISQKQHNKATISLNGRLCNHAAIEVDEMKVNIIGNVTELIYWYIANPDDTARSEIRLTSGINTLPKSYAKDDGQTYNIGFAYISGDSEITITQIPSHAGALCSDGVNDFGKVTGLPIYKDYTVIARYQRLVNNYNDTYGGSSVLSKSPTSGQGAFLFNTRAANGIQETYSFGLSKGMLDIDDMISGVYYQSKYINNGVTINTGTAEDSTDMWLGTFRDNDSRFFNGAIYSLMTFPYSLSEFLIERQLKKCKLGTLYPDMVEFRPIVNSNVKYQDIIFRNTSTGEDLVAGQYYDLGTISIFIKPLGCDEATAVKVNNVDAEFNSYDKNSGYYRFDSVVTKSPQKIDITIDEYIRYEDIDFTDCYPGVPLIYVDDKSVTWGNKLKVGDKFTFYGNVNILPEMYNVLVKAKYNGEEMTYGSIGTITKSMAFTSFRTYTFDTNEPKCILSPSRLRIPNSSYKILGYIPDISGHGNHGKINNSAYAEGSGVNADGSYQLDGVDDFITIPTTVGGKQVIMKVIWDDAIADAILYDQRGYSNEFAIYNADNDNSGNPVTAYQARNNGKTYIDGILNSNIKASELKNVNHIITITNELSSGANNSFPTIGSNILNDDYFTKMALYDFLLFDEISTDEEILTLNEYIGIEPKSKEGLLYPSITVNGSYVVLNTVEDTNDYLVNGTANCGIGFSDESASEQFSTGVTYDKNFSYSIVVIANNNKELISLSHNGVSADSIQSMDYSETTKLYICSTTNGMFAVGSAPQEIIIELSD